jgi:hypothetical protein
MKDLKNSYKKIILLVISFVVLFHTTLWADSVYSEESYIKSAYSSDAVSVSTSSSSPKVEISLNSFGSISVMIMLVLTSLLGAFFVRDEFSNVLD